MSLSASEAAELKALNDKVLKPGADGRYAHWSQRERDRVRELLRKEYPAIQFAPSTEEIGRRFGRESQR